MNIYDISKCRRQSQTPETDNSQIRELQSIGLLNSHRRSVKPPYFEVIMTESTPSPPQPHTLYLISPRSLRPGIHRPIPKEAAMLDNL